MPSSSNSTSPHLNGTNQICLPTKQADMSFKPSYLKDLTDAEVENIIVQHSQSAPRESTIFENEKKKKLNQIKKQEFLSPSASQNLPAPWIVTNNSATALNSTQQKFQTNSQRDNYSPVPLYQRQACHNLSKSENSWPKIAMLQKQKFNNVIQRGINMNYGNAVKNQEQKNQDLSIGSFDDPIECDYSDSDKPSKSLEKTSSLSSIDDSMTTLSHLSDLNISEDSQFAFNHGDSLNSGNNSILQMNRPKSLR